MAEREGFEPPEPLGSPDFESGRLNQTPEPLRASSSAFPLRGEQSSECPLWRASPRCCHKLVACSRGNRLVARAHRMLPRVRGRRRAGGLRRQRCQRRLLRQAQIHRQRVLLCLPYSISRASSPKPKWGGCSRSSRATTSSASDAKDATGPAATMPSWAEASGWAGWSSFASTRNRGAIHRDRQSRSA